MAPSLGIEGRLLLETGEKQILLRRLSFVTGDTEWSLPAGQRARVLYREGQIEVSDMALVRGVSDRAMDLQLSATSLRVLDREWGTAEIDADLTVSGVVSAPVVRGTVTLESGRLEITDVLEGTTSEPYSIAVNSPSDTDQTGLPQTPWDRATVGVTARLPDHLVLRGRDVRVPGGSLGIGDMNFITGGPFEVRKRPGSSLDPFFRQNSDRSLSECHGDARSVRRDHRGSAARKRPVSGTLAC